jgi:hypothetical protein
MITYASFCSIFLFIQNPEQDLPLASANTEMAQQVHLFPTIQSGIWLQITFRTYRRKVAACR